MNIRGQTALILILLTAAALIFLAITLNWGRIAQVKSLLTVAADSSASALASDAASYGEMLKQTYLQNTNYQWGLDGVLLSVIILIVAIVLMFTPAGQALSGWAFAFAIAGMVMTFATIVLQLVWINPMISAMWNKLQKNQPTQQQFFEQSVGTALQGAVTDQVNITDYFDWNANGIMGNNASGFPLDVVGRFAVYYTDRLRMLNQTANIPQIGLFYNQLGELVNGETCAEYASDHALDPSLPPLVPAPPCPTDCLSTPTDPVCQLKIPGTYQLNDPCVDSNPGSPNYNPYCDPCCQPPQEPNPDYCNCSTTTTTTSGPPSTTCSGTTSSNAACNYNPLVSQYVSLRPSSCDPSKYDLNGMPQCGVNNPYNTLPGGPFTLIYDPAYQEYSNNQSFLDLFGRDQQAGPFTNLTPQGNFPNGVYPFFWLTGAYSPEVDNIVPTTLTLAQDHWCTAAAAPGYVAPTPGFTDLQQLTLLYTCSSADCCVNYLANTVTGGIPAIGTTASTTVIDMVGSTSFAANAPNPASNAAFGETGVGTWLQGDNQMCSASWPYNGATVSMPDGTCEWTGTTTAPPATTPVPLTAPLTDPPSTVDALDDTMHTLSDFVNFANNFLAQDVGTLNASFDTWYPQVAEWIAPACGGSVPAPACNGAGECLNNDGSTSDCGSSGTCSDGTPCTSSNGRLLSIYNPYTGFDLLNTWNGLITPWLENNYASANAWCVPPSTDPSMNVAGVPIAENTYIATNGAAIDAQDPHITSTWGDMGYVIACMKYNSPAGPAINNLQSCQALLTTACPAAVAGTACDPVTLGRSLAGAAPVFDGCTGNYATWVNNSLILATYEAPKFALRSLFLSDIYTRAQNMQNIFSQGDTEIKNFMNGPAANLINARLQPDPTTCLPNSVIYGWVDNPYPNGQPGNAHVVKVTAYSPARNGCVANGTAPNGTTNTLAQSLLPWIKTTVHLFTRDYELRNRDGYVYVSVKRWDEDHSNKLFFPNGHILWQFLFQNPSGGITATGSGIPGFCQGLGGLGFGLRSQTVNGLTTPQQTNPPLSTLSSTDQTALQNAFMLDDEGNGSVDPNAKGTYSQCLTWANQMLASAPESDACVEYVASSPASDAGSVTSGFSGHNDADYSVKFVNCKNVPGYPPPDDLTGAGGS